MKQWSSLNVLNADHKYWHILLIEEILRIGLFKIEMIISIYRRIRIFKYYGDQEDQWIQNIIEPVTRLGILWSCN